LTETREQEALFGIGWGDVATLNAAATAASLRLTDPRITEERLRETLQEIIGAEAAAAAGTGRGPLLNYNNVSALPASLLAAGALLSGQGSEAALASFREAVENTIPVGGIDWTQAKNAAGMVAMIRLLTNQPTEAIIARIESIIRTEVAESLRTGRNPRLQLRNQDLFAGSILALGSFLSNTEDIGAVRGYFDTVASRRQKIGEISLAEAREAAAIIAVVQMLRPNNSQDAIVGELGGILREAREERQRTGREMLVLKPRNQDAYAAAMLVLSRTLREYLLRPQVGAPGAVLQGTAAERLGAMRDRLAGIRARLAASLATGAASDLERLATERRARAPEEGRPAEGEPGPAARAEVRTDIKVTEKVTIEGNRIFDVVRAYYAENQQRQKVEPENPRELKKGDVFFFSGNFFQVAEILPAELHLVRAEVVEDPFAEKFIIPWDETNNQIRMGRGSGNDIQFERASVSREQVRISRNAQGMPVLEDLGSYKPNLKCQTKRLPMLKQEILCLEGVCYTSRLAAIGLSSRILPKAVPIGEGRYCSQENLKSEMPLFLLEEKVRKFSCPIPGFLQSIQKLKEHKKAGSFGT
jgi:hypothetical protein